MLAAHMAVNVFIARRIQHGEITKRTHHGGKESASRLLTRIGAERALAGRKPNTVGSLITARIDGTVVTIATRTGITPIMMIGGTITTIMMDLFSTMTHMCGGAKNVIALTI